MIRKLLKKDLYRNKLITASLCIFILLSSCLGASSISILVKLSSSMDSFFDHTAAPDFVQMHAGDFQQEDIDTFVEKHQDIVCKQQTITLANIKGSQIFINQIVKSEEGSVMDIAFVTQSSDFDYLINEENEIVHVKEGEIAVPIYYQQRDGLKKEDIVYVAYGGSLKEFVIVDFIKDAQMNASIISSKRMLVSDQDYQELSKYASAEYLIEFLSEDTTALEMAYQKEGMPHNGTTITKGLLYVLNALMDGIVAMILLLISILLMGIAFLCLRFTILMTQEEDVKEIGIMKAIGIAQKDIQRLYLGKYIALSIIGCSGGYLCAVFFQPLIFSNIQLYMGVSDPTIMSYVFPILMVLLVGICILSFCKLILHRMHRITPLQALHHEVVQVSSSTAKQFPLAHHRKMPLSFYLSFKDILSRKRIYGSVFFVILLSSFLMIVPFHLQSTIASKDFIRYMGIGNSDMRMDIFYEEDTEKQEIEEQILHDTDVRLASSYTTYQVERMNKDNEWQSLQVETGDFTQFPLTYHQGSAPVQEDEIAISYAIANEEGYQLKDQIKLQIGDIQQSFTICGIYQDVTNGGKSAKLKKEIKDLPPLRCTINVDFEPHSDISSKYTEYSQRFTGVKITDTQGYVTQTLSGLIEQVRSMVTIALLIAFIITFFQISLFLKMLLKKDEREITIMKCLGFTKEQLQLQYILRLSIVAIVGIIAGTAFASMSGEYLLSIAMSPMGIARLSFTIQPMITYVLLPLFLISSVGIATILATRNIGHLHIANVTIE